MKNLVISSLIVLAALVACNQPEPPPVNDPFFAGQESFGASVPTDSTQVSAEEFKRLVQQDELVLDSAKRRQDQKTNSEAQFKSDEAQIKLLAQTNPVFQKVLTPDPSVGLLSDGNYVLTVQGKSGAFEVVTDGPRRQFRRLLESRAKFNDVANQLRVYSNGFNMLPDNLRTGLPTPTSLTAATLKTVLDARLELEKRLLANPDTLEDAQAVVTTKSNTREVNPDAKPSGFPASELQEEGRGEGIDHEGNCQPNSFSGNGLYQNFWWKQKFYHTSVKSQGRRGSCVGFAVTAALEGKIAIEKNRWVNLSEQFLWAKIAGEWDYREYGDGANTSDTANEFFDTNYKLPMESVWNYNKSRSRLPKKEEQADHYSFSCKDYDEFCSNTSHQQQYFCTTQLNITYCGYKKPAATGEKFGIGESDNIYDWSSWSLPVAEMRALLRQGNTLVAGLTVNVGFDNPSNDGIIHTLSDNAERGGHAVQIVGFISASRVANHPSISSSVKNYAQNSGGGYFIIKNSWGYCFGDAGYIYVPVAWAEEYFTSVEVIYVNPSAAFNKIPNLPPSIQITAPQNNVQGNQEFNQFTLKATATDPDGGTPVINWNSSLAGNLGSGAELTVSFSQLGAHKITATATDSSGATDSAQITINIVSQAPTATIAAPSSNQTLYRNQTYPFEGSGEDGLLTLECSALVWSSSKAGEGPWAGCAPNISFTSNGTRTITLTATDATNLKGTDTVSINVVDPPLSGPPVVEITYPKTTPYYDPFGKVRLSYTLTDPGATNTSQYTVVWKAWTKRTNITTITPKPYAINNILIYKYFIPSEYFPTSACGDLYTVNVSVTITDPEGLSDTDTVQIVVVGVPC